jgi:hypothetical protein
MRDQRPDLGRDGDFLKLWLGETISQLGSQITTLALPLTAVLLLIGTLLGGALASTIGLRPTLFIAALGGTLALGWVVASPLPRLRSLPGEAVKEGPGLIGEVA